MTEYISLHKLYQAKSIYWIKSFPTLRKWVLRDYNTNNILETKIIPSISSTGQTDTRYYIPIPNVSKYVKAFEEGNLYDKNN